MTIEEKKNWLHSATAEEVLHQYRSMLWRVGGMEFGKERLQLQEDIDLTEAELRFRLGI